MNTPGHVADGALAPVSPTGVTSADPLRALVARPGATCPHCAYSLAGLADAPDAPTRCPECGGGLLAGLIGSTGPRLARRLMVLMFAWLACAGVMNATRWWMSIEEFLARQAAMNQALSQRAAPGSSIAIIRGRIIGPATPPSPVPDEFWGHLAWWSALATVGVGGIVATAFIRPGRVRLEKRLIALLVLAFVGYWGYHAYQFTLDMIRWLGA